MAKFKIKINDPENIRELLQTAYELAETQIVQAQNEINKLANSTNLQEEIMEAKAKYATSINNYLAMKDKAISKKIDIAKLLTEIYKHNGDLNNTLNDSQAMKGVSFDFSKIRDIVNESSNRGSKKEIIELKKDK